MYCTTATTSIAPSNDEFDDDDILTAKGNVIFIPNVSNAAFKATIVLHDKYSNKAPLTRNELNLMAHVLSCIIGLDSAEVIESQKLSFTNEV